MNRKGLGLIELLIGVAVVCLLTWFAVKQYTGKGASSLDDKTKQELSKEGIKTDTSQNMQAGAQSKLDDYNKNAREAEAAAQQIPE